MPLTFSTKAATLEALESRLHGARVAPLVRFTVAQWRGDSTSQLAHMRRRLGEGPWIVRSSRQSEDALGASMAGAFLSVLNVRPGDVVEAVERVIAAYGEASPADEVLVQPMLAGVLRSGVAFSHDPQTAAPYRVVSWSEGDDTQRVTGGRSGSRTWQGAASSPVPPPKEIASVVELLDEIGRHFGGAPLDCEFAITAAGEEETLWLLQARPLMIAGEVDPVDSQAHRLRLIAEKISRGMRPHPFVLGRRTVYGVMPDWNPAEIVGLRPKPLALSLYRELVTDAIWAYQRHNYGYRNLRSFPLMPHMFGMPYIDVRLSFNSFIPAELDTHIAGRLVDYYIDRLLAEPALHDKIEFEIVFSCYTLDLPERLERLADAGFSGDEREHIRECLRRLTNRIIHTKEGLWRADAEKLKTLEARRLALYGSDADALERIYWLLEDAKRYGTLPFAGLARAGFIAVQMLRSLVSVGVLTSGDYDAFMASVSTVSGQLAHDRAALDRTTFLTRYGHLRPGTYDILSPRYDEAPDVYFDWTRQPPLPAATRPFRLTLPQMREIARLLEAHGLYSDPVGLFDFVQAGIELREFAKFEFTRNLSDALALVAAVGERWGFSREDMAYCDIRALQELHVGAADPRELLADAIVQGRARHRQTLSLALPPVIAAADDVWAFEWPETSPNFITRKRVTAPVVTPDLHQQLAGSIVCIPNADPGFDWLFAHSIAGLITTWGGANSHIAIRAGELGIPAVIGAGELLYRRWSVAQRLHLDCAARRVDVVG